MKQQKFTYAVLAVPLLVVVACWALLALPRCSLLIVETDVAFSKVPVSFPPI